MTRKIRISELQAFDVTDYLSTEADIAAYLTVVREDNDAPQLLIAMQDVARARARFSAERPRPALARFRPSLHPAP